MQGCIIKNEEISIKDIYAYIENVDEYNWLITNIECYPNDEKIVVFRMQMAIQVFGKIQFQFSIH